MSRPLPDSWSDERARVVLSHELAHICRGDWIVQLSAELLRAFYSFNPLLWVACRRLRLESEHACNNEVMSRGVEHGADYATHLIELARALNQRRYICVSRRERWRVPRALKGEFHAMLNVHLDRGPISRRHPRGDLPVAVRRHGSRGCRAERLRDVQRDDRRRIGPAEFPVRPLRSRTKRARRNTKSRRMRSDDSNSSGCRRESTASKRRESGFNR